MSIDTRDQNSFEDRLLTAILDDFDELTGPVARPGPARGRRAAYGLIVGVAGGAAAIAGIIAAGVTGPAVRVQRHGAPQAGHTSARPVTTQTAAYVVDHLTSALVANTAVEYVLEHAPNSQGGPPVISESWSSSLSHTYRITDLNRLGRPVTGYLVTITAHRTVSITINYRNRTWAKVTYPFGSSASAHGPAPEPLTLTQLAGQLRAAVKAGKASLDRRVTVDGQHAIRLTEHVGGGQVDLWISPATFLPIRQIDRATGVSPGSDEAIRDDYRWLPATRANLRLLTPAAAIPAGFSQTSPGAGN